MENNPSVLVLNNSIISKIGFWGFVISLIDKKKIIEIAHKIGYVETIPFILINGKELLILNNS